MPLDAVKVGLAVQSGVSIVCASCERYWEGRDRGLPEPKCTTPRPCGSPLAGHTFSEYRGPLTTFDRWCFVCGSTAKYGVKVGQSRPFGMCGEHIGLLEQLEPVGLNGVPAVQVIAAKKADADALLVIPKKTLGQAIAEAEAQFAQEDKP